MSPGGRGSLLGLAAVAVAFAAADTYVVVLALPDMMASSGIPIDELQRGAPIVSGFLLGYVAMLPLIGRIADLRGRVPVLVAALVLFAVGSLVTTLAYDLPTLVAGRFLQGVGGGGLVPGDARAGRRPLPRRPARRTAGRRVGGPGARQRPRPAVRRGDPRRVRLAGDLRWSTWSSGWSSRPLVRRVSPAARPTSRPTPRVATVDWAGAACSLVALRRGRRWCSCAAHVAGRDVTWGQLFIPVVGSSRWLTPLGLVAIVGVRCSSSSAARRPAGRWSTCAAGAQRRARPTSPARCSWPPRSAGVILAFATADPRVEVFAPRGRWYLLGAARRHGGLVWHLRTDESPAGPARRAAPYAGLGLAAGQLLRRRRADRGPHRHPDLRAHHGLPRLAAARRARPGALPRGAARSAPWSAATSPAASPPASSPPSAWSWPPLGFVLMSRWDLTTLAHGSANVPLVVGGLGFGLALAPVNAAVLATTDDEVHGLASAGVVVVADGRDAGRHLGPHHDRPASLLRRDRATCHRRCRSAAARPAAARRSTTCSAMPGSPRSTRSSAAPPVCALVAAVLALVLFRGARRRPGRSLASSVGDPRPTDTSTTCSPPTRRTPRASSDGDFDGIAHAGVAIVTCMDSRIDPLGCSGSSTATRRSSATPAAGSRRRRSRRWCSASTCWASTASWSSRTPAARWRPRPRPSSTSGSPSRPASTSRGSTSTSVPTSSAALADDVDKVRTHPLIAGRAAVGGFLYDVDTGRLTRHA